MNKMIRNNKINNKKKLKNLNKILIYVLNAKTAFIYMMKHRVGDVLSIVKNVLIILNAQLVSTKVGIQTKMMDNVQLAVMDVNSVTIKNVPSAIIIIKMSR